MKKAVVIILAFGVVVGGGFAISGGKKSASPGISEPYYGEENAAPQNIVMENGKQIITIDAKGGYFPRKTEAQAGVPTIIRMKTRGTFDCSSAFTIPQIDYRNNLPRTGTTDIEVPPQESGAALNGLCGMGMYSFSVNFK